MIRFPSIALVLALAGLTASGTAADTSASDLAAGAGDIPAGFERSTHADDYSRLQVMVPMRDGVKLFTVVLIPKHVDGPMPIVLTRTPYDASGYVSPEEGASPRMSMNMYADNAPLARAGYILAFQDIRGRYASEGSYVVNRPPRGPLNRSGVDHSTDAWDTIEWLVRNVPGNNGRVGITGVSYDGFLALMALLEPHPALAAVVPINPMVDSWLGDDWYHNGALRQTMVQWFYKYTSTKEEDLEVPWGYRDLFSAFLEAGSASAFGRHVGADRLPAWRRVIDNPAYTRLWQDQAVHRLLERIDLKVPTLMVHALFDQEDSFGALAAYEALERHDARNDRSFLVIGPWYHGQSNDPDGSRIGDIQWGSNTARFFQERVRQAFWDEHLKGRAPETPTPPVLAFETGANEWRRFDAWPPRGLEPARRLYLRQGRKAAFAPPGPDERYTQYVSDPGTPVPYQIRPIRPDYPIWRRWLIEDQRAIATDRPDVVSFLSETLTEPLTVRGQPLANLIAATTGSDADWVIKLIDVYPQEHPQQPELGGYQLMVSAEIFRGRYREGFDTAKPIPAGKPLAYRVFLPHTNHTFQPGHRIMVQVQSTWFPLYDRNPQRFVDNIAYAQPSDFTAATHRIYHAPRSASFVELPR